MYPEYQDKFVIQCREFFSLGWIVSENILHLLTWVIAGWLVWPIRWNGWPIVTIAWGMVVLLVQILLKKHNCSGCYYYGKSCHLGWGKLSAWLFEQDSGNLKTGTRLSLFYLISPPLFLVVGTLAGFFLEVGRWHWLLLGIYVGLNMIVFPVRLKGCRLCAMREVCPGSAAKAK